LAKTLKISALTIGTWANSEKKPVPRMMKKVIKFLGYIPPLGVDKTSLGGQLYIYRYTSGFTQKDIAHQLKIDRSAVTQIENNNKVEKQYKRKIQTLLNL
jgi:DNA-binding XRE family transcriptional regulator